MTKTYNPGINLSKFYLVITFSSTRFPTDVAYQNVNGVGWGLIEQTPQFFQQYIYITWDSWCINPSLNTRKINLRLTKDTYTEILRAHWLGIHVVFIVWISQSNPHFVAARISMVFRHWISQSILYGTVRIPIVQTLINMFFTINFPNFSQTCYLSHRLVQTIHYCPVIFWVNWVNELNKQTNAYRTTLHWFTLDWKHFKRLIGILEVYSSIP